MLRIDRVVDDREDTVSLGEVLPGLRLKRMLVNLEGGAAYAILSYVRKYVAMQDTAMPVTLHIKKLAVNEQQGMTLERLTLTYSYSFYHEGIQLLQYDGEAYIQTSMDASAYIGKLISESIDQTLKKAEEALRNRVPEEPVKIEVTARIAAGSPALADIAYSKSRVLTLADFQGKADNLSRAVAATYSGLSVSYNAVTKGSQIKLFVDVTPSFSPERSWFRQSAKNSKTLAHEQRHFDITAVHGCLLVENIRRATFSPLNFKEELERLQTETNRLLQEAQDQYDTETSHGTNATKQLKWDKNVEAQLRALSCY